jgi:hypothetical protein
VPSPVPSSLRQPEATAPTCGTVRAPGFTEESYHTFSYSPLADDAGRVTGMLCVVSEETEMRGPISGQISAQTTSERAPSAQASLTPRVGL